ncbi:MAG: transposase [Acetobacteraceae bacterium]|nr:transposase [Acetobacteraceae bacterium]
MGRESEAAWLGMLNNLVIRGLQNSEFLIINGVARLEKPLAALWPEVPNQRCTVGKRNLLAHAPAASHDEIFADYTDIIYAKTATEIEVRHRAFPHEWRPVPCVWGTHLRSSSIRCPSFRCGMLSTHGRTRRLLEQKAKIHHLHDFLPRSHSCSRKSWSRCSMRPIDTS